MKNTCSTNRCGTRGPFRVLAGLFGILFLAWGVPSAVIEGLHGGGWPAWAVAAAFAYAGMGLALGAWTGRWYGTVCAADAGTAGGLPAQGRR